VRRRNGDKFFACRHCASTLVVTEATLTHVSLVSPADEPDVRIVLVGGTEVHRCVRQSPRRTRSDINSET
jgi:hypothetical protein